MNKKVGQFGGKFLPFHKGHLAAAQLALQYVDKLYIILFYNDKFDTELCYRDGCKPMTKNIRKAWISNSIMWLRQFGEVELLEIEYDEMEYDWAKGSSQVKKLIPDLTHVFSSEPGYDEFFKKNYPNCTHVILDANRETVNICATQIRKEPFKYWDFMTQPVRKHFVKKICITGTESTGKSTLTAMLGSYFDTIDIQEIGREWCVKYDNNLTPDMFKDIAIKNHYMQDQAAEICNKYLFVDTDSIVTQYYLKQYFGLECNFLHSMIMQQDFDLYLFLTPDVEWKQDQWGHRFLSDNRWENHSMLYSMYVDYKLDNNVKFVNADNYKERFQQAIDFIKLI